MRKGWFSWKANAVNLIITTTGSQFCDEQPSWTKILLNVHWWWRQGFETECLDEKCFVHKQKLGKKQLTFSVLKEKNVFILGQKYLLDYLKYQKKIVLTISNNQMFHKKWMIICPSPVACCLNKCGTFVFWTSFLFHSSLGLQGLLLATFFAWLQTSFMRAFGYLRALTMALLIRPYWLSLISSPATFPWLVLLPTVCSDWISHYLSLRARFHLFWLLMSIWKELKNPDLSERRCTHTHANLRQGQNEHTSTYTAPDWCQFIGTHWDSGNQVKCKDGIIFETLPRSWSSLTHYIRCNYLRSVRCEYAHSFMGSLSPACLNPHLCSYWCRGWIPTARLLRRRTLDGKTGRCSYRYRRYGYSPCIVYRLGKLNIISCVVC